MPFKFQNIDSISYVKDYELFAWETIAQIKHNFNDEPMLKELLFSYFKEYIICSKDINDQRMFAWDSKFSLYIHYEEDLASVLSGVISESFRKLSVKDFIELCMELNINLSKELLETKSKVLLEPYAVARREVRDSPKIKFLFRSLDLKPIMQQVSEVIKTNNNFELDHNTDVWAFKNGNLCLRTGTFKIRTREDFFTQTLHYDYCPEVDTTIVKKIEEQLLHTCNNDVKFYDYFMLWCAYCLTGITTLHKFMSIYGDGANGKSTIFKILKEVFPMYVMSSGSDTFSKSNATSHKQLVKFQRPTRLIFLDETDDSSIHEELVKELVSGLLSVKPLYKSEISVVTHAHLNLCSNNFLKFKNSKANDRRVLYVAFTSSFYSKSELEKRVAAGEKNCFEKIADCISIFKTPEYRNALVHIMLQYTKKFYELNDRNVTDMFDHLSEACSEQSTIVEMSKDLSTHYMDSYLENNFILTGDNNDFVYLSEMFPHFLTTMGKNESDWTSRSFIKNVKEHGKCKITYDSKSTRNGKSSFFIGLKLKPVADPIITDPVVADPIITDPVVAVVEDPVVAVVADPVEKKKIKIVKKPVDEDLDNLINQLPEKQLPIKKKKTSKTIDKIAEDIFGSFNPEENTEKPKREIAVLSAKEYLLRKEEKMRITESMAEEIFEQFDNSMDVLPYFPDE
jgi:phage/plasmid-associated DNA primase